MRLSLCINRPWRPSVHGRDNQHGRSYSNSRSERHRPCHASGFRLAVLQEEKKNDGEKRACTAECRAAIVDAVNYHVKSKYRLAKAAGAVSVAHLLSGAGGSVGKMASLGVKTATLGLYYYPVYRYTYRGETYEQIGDVPAMEEQARKKVGTELTLFIDPAKPTSFYCLEEEKGYFQQRLAYLIVALLVIAVLIMIGVMWLTI